MQFRVADVVCVLLRDACIARRARWQRWRVHLDGATHGVIDSPAASECPGFAHQWYRNLYQYSAHGAQYHSLSLLPPPPSTASTRALHVHHLAFYKMFSAAQETFGSEQVPDGLPHSLVLLIVVHGCKRVMSTPQTPRADQF